MDKLTDPNPYEVLGISPNADRRAIKLALAEKQRKNRSQIERQQALNARNALSFAEKRLLVDALIPHFSESSHETDSQVSLEHFIDPAEPLDWRDIVDPDTVIAHDLQALIEVTIRHTIGNVPMPECQPTLLKAFDGLDEFLEAWLQ